MWLAAMKKPGGRVTAPTPSYPPERSVAEEYQILLAMLEQQNTSIESLRATVAQGHEKSSDSRSKIYERIDEVNDRLGKIEGDIRILGQVDGQVRGEIQSLKQTVEANQTEMKPTVDEWKRIRAIGIGFAGLLALGGVSLGAMAMYAGETLVNAVRHWLRIP